MEMGPPFYVHGHPNQAQGKGSTFILVRPRESNPRPPARESSALPTELILVWCNGSVRFLSITSVPILRGHLSSSAWPSWEWGICQLFEHFDEFILDLLWSNKGIRTVRKQTHLKQYVKKGRWYIITFLNKAWKTSKWEVRLTPSGELNSSSSSSLCSSNTSSWTSKSSSSLCLRGN